MEYPKFLYRLPNGNYVYVDNTFEYAVLTNNHLTFIELLKFCGKLFLFAFILAVVLFLLCKACVVFI